MDTQTTYKIVTQAQLVEGFSQSQVQEAVAAAFKLTSAQASKLLTNKQVIKKQLDLPKAKALQKKLASLGLSVAVEAEKPPVAAQASSLDSLALVPTESEIAAAGDAGTGAAKPITITCPKCQLEQPKAEQCTGCGVYLHKVIPAASGAAETSQERPAPRPRQSLRSQASPSTEHDEGENGEEAYQSERLTIQVIGAAAGAAILGALIWKFIAVTFDYELALVAWIIGGMVGFAAALMGSRGVKAGALCGLLALLAIFGGKYMAMDSIKTDLLDVFQTSLQEGDMEAMFAADMQAAQAYNTDVTNEASLRRFMVDYQYTEAATPEGVEAWELEDFNTYVAPELNSLASGELTAEEYYGYDFQQEMADISTGELVMESLGIIDLLFVFLGVGTAFRLGRGET